MIKVLAALLVFSMSAVPAGAGDIDGKYRLGRHGDAAGINVHPQHVAPAPLQPGVEMNMIQLQSLISQRQLAEQLTTQMMDKVNKGQQCVLKKLGR